jgi:hypothetical protein
MGTRDALVEAVSAQYRGCLDLWAIAPFLGNDGQPVIMGDFMWRRHFLASAAGAFGAGLLARFEPATAQSLAGQQIRLIVPFPPGGPTDMVARPLAQLLGDALKSIVVIDNHGGAC